MIKNGLLNKRYRFKEDYMPYKLSKAQEKARQLFLDELHKKKAYKFIASCPYCGSHSFTKISEIDKRGLPSEIALCDSCGGCFKLFTLKPEANRFFYENISYALRGKSSVEGEIEKIFWKRVKSFGNRRYYFISHFLELKPDKDFIVEFGCNDGANLYPWHKRGFKVLGLDLDSRLIDFGRKEGLDLRQEDMLSHEASDKNPNLIMLIHALEHAEDASAVLERIYDMLEPDGYLFIEVPGIRVQGLGNLLKYFDVEHNYHFDLASLRRLLEKNQFKILYADEFLRVLCTPINNAAPRLKSQPASFSMGRIKANICRALINLLESRNKKLGDLLRKNRAGLFKAKLLGRLKRAYFKYFYDSLENR